jgi:hypothetical protein
VEVEILDGIGMVTFIYLSKMVEKGGILGNWEFLFNTDEINKVLKLLVPR